MGTVRTGFAPACSFQGVPATVECPGAYLFFRASCLIESAEALCRGVIGPFPFGGEDGPQRTVKSLTDLAIRWVPFGRAAAGELLVTSGVTRRRLLHTMREALPSRRTDSVKVPVASGPATRDFDRRTLHLRWRYAEQGERLSACCLVFADMLVGSHLAHDRGRTAAHAP